MNYFGELLTTYQIIRKMKKFISVEVSKSEYVFLLPVVAIENSLGEIQIAFGLFNRHVVFTFTKVKLVAKY